MSSHHIIRENQEAAIFLVDKKAIHKAVLESFFEWSPLILASEKCFVLLNKWGFKADAVVCEKGFSENYEPELAMQQPLEIIEVNHQQQVVSEGLKFLYKKKCTAVNIFTKNMNLWKELSDSNMQNMNINVVQGNLRGIHIHSGLYEKWFPAESMIKVVPGVADQLFIFKYQSGSFYKQKLSRETEINLDAEGLFSISSYQAFQVWEHV